MKRIVNLPKLLEKSSHFLLGPRGTGKTYLIREQLGSSAKIIDLLDSQTYLRLKTHPEDLRDMIRGESDLIVIDEVQRIPEILNEVHLLIESENRRFLLTGSSARKLRRGGANLLAGRALQAWMQPLTWHELSNAGQFDLERYLLLGGLPTAYLQEIGQDFLYSYVDLYLREEIHAEALVKNLANFTRFLECAALASGEIVNFASVGNDAQLSPTTVHGYYQILEDTLLGYRLNPWTKTRKRKASQTGKFYLFDVGVLNAINRVSSVPRSSDLYGRLFEHFIAQEIIAYLRYERKRLSLNFWRTQARPHFEVDFLVGDDIAIEVKATRHASERDHRGLLALAEEKNWKHLLVVSQDPLRKKYSSGIEHIPWQNFLEMLWRGDLC